MIRPTDCFLSKRGRYSSALSRKAGEKQPLAFWAKVISLEKAVLPVSFCACRPMFLKYLLKRNIRYQDDLVDQLFNSSEKRLARVLLLMAQFGKEGVSQMSVPRLSQATLAEMVGTTRSRVSFFMNRFRKLGFINYDVGDILHVHSSLLNVVLHDDDGTTVTPDTKNSAAPAGKDLEPPAEPGGPPDKERARRPPLPSLERRRLKARL